ncbi:MAG TPA: hypothetical protein VFW19_02965 [Allosphingosinicella sp.]|nr:hypothetical protein [Allosphingosinicella sp.]
MRWPALLAASVMALGAATSSHAGPSAVAHYDIKARLDVKAQTVAADVAITLPAREVGRETAFVLGDWMKVERADGGPGATVRIEPTDKPFKGLNRIVFTWSRAPKAPVTLHFRYSGSTHSAADKPTLNPQDGFELGFEDGWAPVRPNFNLQFTADADIEGVPADEVAVAQGQVRHVGDRLIIHRAFEDLDMPFSALTGLKKAAGPSVEVYARDLDGPQARVYREVAGPIVAYYTRLFTPLPPSALPARLVILPRQGAAYERRAYISIGDGTEELKKIGHYEDWQLAATVAHEFAHGWWSKGDPLTEDNWLNESMAEYSSLRFTEATAGEGALKQRLDRKREPAKTAGPIIGRGRPSKNASYAKGPLLLFDLDKEIGRKKMDALLRRLGRNPPAKTAQFLHALAEVAGPEVARNFEARLRAP